MMVSVLVGSLADTQTWKSVHIAQSWHQHKITMKINHRAMKYENIDGHSGDVVSSHINEPQPCVDSDSKQ